MKFWNWFIPFLLAVILFLSVVYDATAQSFLLTMAETTTTTPDTSFSLNDSTGFAADSINFGQDTSKTWNVTAENVTWAVDLTDSSEAGITTTSNSFTVLYTPTVAGDYTDSVKLTTSLLDTLYLGITGTGVDTASGTPAPSEPVGNYVNFYDFEGTTQGMVNIINDEVWINNSGGDGAWTVETANPIYGDTSITFTQSTTQSIGSRPILYFQTTGNFPQSTAFTFTCTIRNNTANDLYFSLMYVAGIVNIISGGGETIAGNTQVDVSVTGFTSSTTDYGFIGFYVSDGNSVNHNFTIDAVTIIETP